MATESPLIRDGGQCVLSTALDYRRSQITGTTLNGPNGSGQYYCMQISTAATGGRTVINASSTADGGKSYGILQNTPGPGQAVDIGFIGITKALSGSTAILAGNPVMASSTFVGGLIPGTTTAGAIHVGLALEPATAVGQVFSMALYGFGLGKFIQV